MKEKSIVLFDGWLETLGGGERQVLSAASALRSLGTVSVVSHRPLRWTTVVERAAVDLDGVRFRTLPERPQLSGREVAGDADLFVNGTHHSLVDGRGLPSMRFVYFPARNANRARRMAGQALRRLAGNLGAAYERSGWFGTEVHQRVRYRQSDGAGRIGVGEGACLRLWISAMTDVDRAYTIQTGAGKALTEGLAGPKGDFAPSPWVEVPRGCRELVVHSAASLGTNERESRLLGLALGSIEEQGPPPRRLFQRTTRRLVPALGSWASDDREEQYAKALRSYDVVTPNSHFTASWLKRRWGVTGPVIEPPVVAEAHAHATRQPLIVSIGRFFVGSHNKKHLVMVRAFRKLCDRGLVGWRLALVGGVGQQPADSAYLREVQQAAEGLPIDVHPDADEATVNELQEHAAIGWHAAGFGESERRTPERFEHFGMAVAELMMSGAVPVVFDGGGLREIVEPGRSGYRWRTLDELADATLALARNGRRRSEIADAARRRAARWSLADYQRRIVNLALEVMDGHSGRRDAA
ncbi:MAG: glycosyltransferase [Chloroflexota bacterium]|nr:glycosyltransferase [Chloroflexota bacterium]MDE2920949.1 glycosyltransferase [Chloroflexota bacterium]